MNTIIYDLEGVIINTEIIWDITHKQFLKKLNLIDKKNIKQQITGKTLLDGTIFLKEVFNLNESLSSLIELRKDLIIKCLKNNITFIDGFFEFHNKVKAKRLKYCIATSMDKELFNCTNLSRKLIEIFENNIFFVSEQKLSSKPSPDIFKFAASRMNSISSQCIVIEDSPIGIDAAKNANMTCIALSSTFDNIFLSKADFIYNNFDEIDLDSIINNI